MKLVMDMTLQQVMKEKGLTRYQLSKTSGIPWATLSDICSGRTKLERCSGNTLMKLSGALGLSLEQLLALKVEKKRPPAETDAQEAGLPADLQKAIRELTKDKTILMIAHRLSTVRTADQIIVLENGRIVQRGNHEELMREDGLYRRFVGMRSQAIGWTLKGGKAHE